MDMNFDKYGLRKSTDKVKSLQKIPSPKDITSLRVYFVVLNYNHKSLPDLMTIIRPMNAQPDAQPNFVCGGIIMHKLIKRHLQFTGLLKKFCTYLYG